MQKAGLRYLAKCLTITVLASAAQWSAKALADTEEYLPIPELNYQAPKKSADEDYSIFDEVRLHAGAAFLNSFQDFLIAPGVRQRGGVRGAQINFGVDLFSEHWIIEGDLINIPTSSLGDTTISQNGFELRLNYETAIIEAVTVHGGLGVASRNYNITTMARPDGTVGSGSNSFSSGATVLEAGADYWINAQVSAGVEVANHLPMANGDDPSSMDLAIKVNGHF